MTSGLGIALQVSDVVAARVVDGRRFPASVRTAGDVVDLAEHLEAHFDRLWLSDNIGHRSTTALLGAIAARTATLGLGTFTAFPHGRSVVDVAAALSTVKELLGARDLAYGVSRGSRAVTALHESDRPLRLLEEHVVTLKALLAGGSVEAAQVPRLARTVALRPEGVLRMEAPPADVPVLLTSTGHQTLGLAGAVADGIQFVTQQPTQSAALLAEPDFPARSGLAAVDRARAQASSGGGFRRIYGISVCLAPDPDDALWFARRQVAGVIATKRGEQLAEVGIDPEVGAAVRRAMDDGGLAEASAHVPEAVVQSLVITGAPRQVADQVLECIERSKRWGFEEHFLCFPLGPDIKSAIALIVNDVLPALGPEHRRIAHPHPQPVMGGQTS